MRPRWSDLRLLLAASLAAAVLMPAAIGSSSARFTATATGSLTTTTRAACSPTNPYPATLGSAPYLPSLWWRFDTGTGATTVTDASGHGGTGSVQGTGLALGAPGLIPCDTTFALRQPGDGVTQGFVVLPTLRTAPTSWSISTVVTTSALTGGRLVGFGDSATAGSTVNDRALLLDTSGRPVLHLRTSTGNLVLAGPATIADGTAHMLVATFNGSVARMYVDGVAVATSLATTPAAPYSGTWRAGWDSGAAAVVPGVRDQAAATQDEVAVWEGRALTAAEVTTLVNANHW